MLEGDWRGGISKRWSHFSLFGVLEVVFLDIQQQKLALLNIVLLILLLKICKTSLFPETYQEPRGVGKILIIFLYRERKKQTL